MQVIYFFQVTLFSSTMLLSHLVTNLKIPFLKKSGSCFRSHSWTAISTSDGQSLIVTLDFQDHFLHSCCVRIQCCYHQECVFDYFQTLYAISESWTLRTPSTHSFVQVAVNFEGGNMCLTQTCVLHKHVSYTNMCLTQTCVLHKHVSYTNTCLTQTRVLHKHVSYTNMCLTQTCVLHKHRITSQIFQWLWHGTSTYPLNSLTSHVALRPATSEQCSTFIDRDSKVKHNFNVLLLRCFYHSHSVP